MVRRWRVLTSSADGTVRLWSLDGSLSMVFEAHKGPVRRAAFNPEGTRIVSASLDGTARIWDTASGVELLALAEHDSPVFDARFGPLGRRVVTASRDGSAWLFDLPATTQDLIDHAKSIVPRELTPCERKHFFLPVEGEVGDCPN